MKKNVCKITALLAAIAMFTGCAAGHPIESQQQKEEKALLTMEKEAEEHAKENREAQKKAEESDADKTDDISKDKNDEKANTQTKAEEDKKDDKSAKSGDDADQSEPTVEDEVVTIETSAYPVTATRMRSLEHEIIDKINDYRAEHDLYPLKFDPRVEETALIRSAEYVMLPSHTRPDGTICWTAGPGYWVGENLCRSYMTTDEALQAWINSPSHNELLLTDEFTGAFCGILFYEGGGATWALEVTV